MHYTVTFLNHSLFTNKGDCVIASRISDLRKRPTLVYEDSVLGPLLARTPLRVVEKKPTLWAKPWSPKMIFYDRSSHDPIPINGVVE